MSKLTPIPPGKHLTPEERAIAAYQICRAYGEFASIRIIAHDIGRSFGFVHRILTECGIPFRERGGGSRSNLKSVASSYAGETVDGNSEQTGRQPEPRD